MKNMLKFEFYKLFRTKAFYICSGIILGLILLFSYIMNEFSLINALDFTEEFIENIPVELIFAVFIGLFICDDNSNGTIKNIYAKGYSREVVYFAKYIVLFITSFVLISFYILFSFAWGNLLWGTENYDITQKDIYIIISQVIFIMERYTFCFAVSTIISRKGAAIAINIILPQLAEVLSIFIDMLLDFEEPYIYNHILRNLYNNIYNNETFLKFSLFALIYSVVFMLISSLINNRKQV